MTVAPMSELTRLPERQAVQRFFDSENWTVLRWALVVLWALALDLLLIFFRRRPFVGRLARPLL